VLSDHERKTLAEVERRLIADDPEFAQSFRARQTSLQRDPHRRGATIAAVAAVLLVVLMLLAGSLVGALGSVVTTALIWAMWRYSMDTDPSPT
jgi:hypothetical protein